VREKYRRPEGPRYEVENGVLGLQFETPPQALQGLGQANCAQQAGRAARGDQFMEKVNARNNEPGLYPSDHETPVHS
jgi:hypothetical protein